MLPSYACLGYLLVVLLPPGLASKPLPDFLHPCKRNDPDINKCITNAILDLKPQLKSGMPEYNVPSIEPLHIDKLIAGDGIGITVTTTNIEVYGCSNFTINRMDASLPDCKFDFDISFDHLKITGKYNINGRILLIPIKGEGTMGSDVYNAKAKCSLKCELFKEVNSEDDFARFTGLDMAIDVNKGKLHLDNLFGNERILGEVINTAINLNFRQFIEELKPLIQKTLSEFMLVTANNIIRGYTYDVVFPSD